MIPLLSSAYLFLALAAPLSVASTQAPVTFTVYTDFV